MVRLSGNCQLQLLDLYGGLAWKPLKCNKPLPHRLTRGYLICITGTVLWSSTAIFIRYLTETYAIPALVLAFWRDLTLALTLGLFFLIFRRVRLVLPAAARCALCWSMV